MTTEVCLFNFGGKITQKSFKMRENPSKIIQNGGNFFKNPSKMGKNEVKSLKNHSNWGKFAQKSFNKGENPSKIIQNGGKLLKNNSRWPSDESDKFNRFIINAARQRRCNGSPVTWCRPYAGRPFIRIDDNIFFVLRWLISVVWSLAALQGEWLTTHRPNKQPKSISEISEIPSLHHQTI